MPDIISMIIWILVLIIVWVMLYDSNRFVVVPYTFSDTKIRGTLKMIVLADLHNKCYGKNNEKLIKEIDILEPDAIVIAGDLLTATPGAKLNIALDLLEQLKLKYPIYYANGNHEHRLELYPETYGELGNYYKERLQSIGVERLVNQHANLPIQNICFYGAEIDRYFYKRFQKPDMEETYLDGVLGKPDKYKYNILIAHNPDYFTEYAKWGADLVLAGHIHGGVIRLPISGRGMLSPMVRFFPKYDGGMYKLDNSTMVLSRGLGMHSLPFRFRLGNPGELVVIHLEEEKTINKRK